MSEVYSLKDAVTLAGAIRFQAEAGILEIAQHVGQIVKDPISGCFIDRLSNSHQSRTNSRHLSFGYDKSELPFHTDYPNLDIPPRFVLLRCISEGWPLAATQYAWLSKFAQSPLAEKCVTEPWLVQTRLGRWKPCRIVRSVGRGLTQIRFSTNVMRPFFKNRSELIALSSNANKIFPTLEFQLKRGEYLLLDNWAGLHRRTLVGEDVTLPKHIHNKNRVLDRVLIS